MTSSEDECFESMCMKATELLKLRPYKTTIVRDLKDKVYKTSAHSLEELRDSDNFR